MRHLKQRGIGVLITDHNVRETLGLIDRAYIIHSGAVLTQGSPEEIIAHPEARAAVSRRELSDVDYSSSPNLSATSAVSASSASCACAPRAATVIVEPSPRPQRQNAHNGIAADRLSATRHADLGLESVDALHKFGRRAGVQTLAVDDFQLPEHPVGEYRRRRTRAAFLVDLLDHLAVKTLLATVMYLRPASRASITA